MIFQSIWRVFRARANPALNTYDENTNADLSCDLNGVLWVRTDGVSSTAWEYQAVPAIDVAFIQNAIGKTLKNIHGFNDSANTVYVQLFDSLVVNPGDSPVMTFLVLSNGQFSWQSDTGRLFASKMLFAISSTRDTYTPLVENIFLFAQGT